MLGQTKTDMGKYYHQVIYQLLESIIKNQMYKYILVLLVACECQCDGFTIRLNEDPSYCVIVLLVASMALIRLIELMIRAIILTYV